MHPTKRTPRLLLLASLIFLAANGAHAAAPPILLQVDARDVSRRVLHATLHILSQPGALMLVYPKWVGGEDGGILEVIPGLPADRAGVGPGMKLLAVTNRRWKPELLRTAIKEAWDGTAPVELLVENGDVFKVCRLDYREGERYPYLEREGSQPDVLAEIIKSRGK